MKAIQFIHGFSVGGAETLVKDYCLILGKEQALAVTLEEYPNSVNQLALNEAEITQYHIPNRLGWKPTRNFFVRLYRKVTRKRSYARELLKIIQEEKADCLHVHLPVLQYVAPISKKLGNVRLFYTCHTGLERLFEGNYEAEEKAARKLLKCANMQMIGLHEEMVEQINRRFGIDNAVVIKNGIDFEKFSRLTVDKQQMKEALQIPQNAYVIGHIGRFAPVKNHGFLVEIFADAAKKNENAFLLLVGDGEEKRAVIDRLNALRLQGRYLVLSNREDIPEILQAMDVFVLPSKSEGFGNALIEAQLAGLPCVQSNGVPNATMLTERIRSVPLEESADVWSDILLNPEKIKNTKIVGNINEYDLRRNLQALRRLYEKGKTL